MNCSNVILVNTENALLYKFISFKVKGKEILLISLSHKTNQFSTVYPDLTQSLKLKQSHLNTYSFIPMEVKKCPHSCLFKFLSYVNQLLVRLPLPQPTASYDVNAPNM